ncbi:hypothetical protein H072_10433 [Dactylellina haptotyla CBS 200.50]|uniref:Peptide hydrolase n=1 Tax=Dactylellina haptotyla (strain CBS 200.50) TaxID=1284197 RepID=S8A0A3_DACHA|nr:hypothetical protein H072_10433 [Dactylellina haptotyla CBS 200.50]
MRFTHSSLATCALCAALVVATPPLQSEGMQSLVTKDGLLRTLKDLDRLASENGGNRAFGLPGYTASVNYVKSRLAKSKKYKSWTQDFPALFSRVESIDFTVTGKSYYIYGLTYSPSTSAEGIDALLVKGPSGTDACNANAYQNLDVKGKIVLVERGTCPTGGTLAGKVRPAVSNGAVAVIVYNNVDTLVTAGTLSAPDPDGYRPAGFINRSDGLDLLKRLDTGEQITAHFQQTQVVETRITQNVFAESKAGDSNNVIMLGAHLDSVQAGAGINDDGSGTSLILELFDAVQHFRPKNKIRFAWWGAEENGLVGSKHYTSHIAKADADKILLYLNFDMVSRGYFGVFDGDGSTHGLAGAPGSDVIEKLFVDHMVSKGITVTPAVFTGGSDYASFMSTLNKPVGGLHTGTGVAQDPCYHQKCDSFENANGTVIEVNAKAAAHVLSVLSNNGPKMVPKTPNNPAKALRTFDGLDSVDLFPWTHVEGESHLGNCGHDA